LHLLPAKEVAVPLVTVKVFERRLDAQSEARIIKAMTDALLEALEAEELRGHTWVLVEGYDPHRWGRGGKPWEEA
jgi:phenylpyruvate tautomerase PptA (4-oxalocrotonate tautomerase family)